MKTLFIILIACMALAPSLHAAGPAKASSKKTALTATELKALGFAGQSFQKKSDGVWKLTNGVTVYSTEAYGSKIRGFAGPTPLFIAVNPQGKIVSIAAGPNMETDEYFSLVEHKLLKKWNGKTLKEAATYKPDAVTGATYSSSAVIRTVNAAASKLK